VEYGQLVESAQLQIAASERQIGGRKPIREKILNWLFTDLKRLNFLAALYRLYQRLGLEQLIQKSGMLKIVSKKLYELSFMAPSVPKRLNYFLGRDVQIKQNNKIRVGILPGVAVVPAFTISFVMRIL
jgi:glycolate oxidase iron-sulfur subunit